MGTSHQHASGFALVEYEFDTGVLQLSHRERIEVNEVQFRTPNDDLSFSIPDDWWCFAEMDGFSPAGGGFYPYRELPDPAEVEVVPIADIEPRQRADRVPLLKKYKLVPVLLAFSSPECALPPIELHRLREASGYRFKVYNGYHRYYASVAAGYSKIATVVRQPLDFL